MPRHSTVLCDFPGCHSSFQETQTPQAGRLVGWVRRQVTDAAKKELAEGVKEFAMSQHQYFCPKHAEQCDQAPSLPLHPSVAEWINQQEPDPAKE